MLRPFLSVSIGLFLLPVTIWAADDPGPMLVGGTIAITAEPDYRPGQTGVLANVLPLVAELPLTNRFGVRLQAIVNLEVKNGELGHLGGGLTVPVYLSSSPGEGWYVGPYCALASVHALAGHDLSLAGEGGVRWLLSRRVTLNLALQVGASLLARPGADSKWVSHLGLYPSLGYWL